MRQHTQCGTGTISFTNKTAHNWNSIHNKRLQPTYIPCALCCGLERSFLIYWGQFHQRFTYTFLYKILVPKITKPNATREKLLSLLSYEKRGRKMLIKLTPGVKGCPKNDDKIDFRWWLFRRSLLFSVPRITPSSRLSTRMWTRHSLNLQKIWQIISSSWVRTAWPTIRTSSGRRTIGNKIGFRPVSRQQQDRFKDML